MKKRIRKLTETQITVLKERYEALKFNTDVDLVYEFQIPNTGIVVLEGQVALTKRKKIQTTVGPGALLGIHNLVYNEPTAVGIKVIGNSELIMINKSDILEAVNDKTSDLYSIIKDEI